MRVNRLWHNARLATLRPDKPGLGVVEDGLIAESEGRIVYAGPAAEASAFEAIERTDCEGRWITPGLIDCHTHLVFAGDRAHEFELRLAGASYEEVARAGGGIVSTVKATRAASEDALVASALPRLDALIAEGVTTIEIKSGYGLELATERRQLRAAKRLEKERRIDVRATFLGAHAMPPEITDKDAYIDLVCSEMLPAVARERLAEAVDAFCEGIAFSPEQVSRVFEAARRHGLKVKLHADQLSNLGGAALAAAFRRALGRPSRIHRRGRRRGDGKSRHGRGAFARRLLLHPRDEGAARSRPSVATRCRWRSRPIAIPAPRL